MRNSLPNQKSPTALIVLLGTPSAEVKPLIAYAFMLDSSSQHPNLPHTLESSRL
jgi:hypothetical protein